MSKLYIVLKNNSSYIILFTSENTNTIFLRRSYYDFLMTEMLETTPINFDVLRPREFFHTYSSIYFNEMFSFVFISIIKSLYSALHRVFLKCY